MSKIKNGAARAASLLSRGAATDFSHGRKAVDGVVCEISHGVAKDGEGICRTYGAHVSSESKTTAFSRGYDLSPLRGSKRHYHE